MRSKDATFRLRALEPLLSRSDAHWIRHCKIDNPSLYRYCQSTLGRPCYALGGRPGPIQIRLLTRGTCVPRQFVYGGTLCPLVLLKWFNSQKGYGFIQPDDGAKDVFVHISAVERAGLGNLQEGQKLRYEIERGQQGKTSAVNLQLS